MYNNVNYCHYFMFHLISLIIFWIILILLLYWLSFCLSQISNVCKLNEYMINANTTNNSPDLWATNCEMFTNFNNLSFQLLNDQFDLQNFFYDFLTSNLRLCQHCKPTSKLSLKNCNKCLFILHVNIDNIKILKP